MKKVLILSVITSIILLLSGCGERMVQWSETTSNKMEESGKSAGDNIREKGEGVSEKLDTYSQDTEATNEGFKEEAKPNDETEQGITTQPSNTPDASPTESPKVAEKKDALRWNKEDKAVMSNHNIKYAVKLLTDNAYEFSEYTYAEQFDRLTKSPSNYYGKIISIAGTVSEITPITKDFDTKYRTTLYADAIRSLLIIDVQGSSNDNNRSILVYSTQTNDKFLLNAEYSISGFLVGTDTTKLTVHLQGQTETNYVELPVIVPDKELVYPMPHEEYINGYLGAYSDDEFLKKMLDELH
ncbi:hypothetical protein [Paenibacillus crassostreae]|uniref:Lipoprotein n=1 Tax=Paenibacillus crassostreae TaxID=1763538 RepID=A0A167EJV1_9BACL|nr:hypothetical protein [Paenibacillus crassostreae]AOZ94932.1 hypothetical protein LPB68_21985 [Paenibacillus crassostreae]OAB75614.1 hypothetical protein PNBC_08275 [Paenibacillus crassostreae]